MRSAAVRRGWGTGKLEARPDTALRRPLAAALHLAVRELGAPGGRRRMRPRARRAQGVRAARRPRTAARSGWPTAGSPGIDVPAVPGRADSGDIEIDLVELLTDLGGLAGDAGRGVALFIDEMQDLGPDDVSALCAACHEISQPGLPLVVVGAGLPHLPAVLSASKSYSERLFRYSRIDRLDRAAADRALRAPAQEEGADFTDEALDAMYAATTGYPYFVQAYGKVAWDVAPRSPDHRRGRDGGRARGRGRAGGRVLRLPLRAGHAGRAGVPAGDGGPARRGRGADVEAPVAVDGVWARGRGGTGCRRVGADRDDRGPAGTASPQSLSPARDALIKKGLVYSGERGRIAFTVPHFGQYLRQHSAD